MSFLQPIPCDPSGPPGPPGPTGPPGINQPISFIYTQPTPANVWTINHNLGFNPNITVQDSAGSTVEGDINYVSINQVIITFSGAFSGVAYLS